MTIATFGYGSNIPCRGFGPVAAQVVTTVRRSLSGRFRADVDTVEDFGTVKEATGMFAADVEVSGNFGSRKDAGKKFLTRRKISINTANP